MIPAARRYLVATLLLVSTFAEASEFGLQVGLESFRWREFDAGQRLLEESGPRLRIGAKWEQSLDQQLALELRGSLYFGQVDYDGRAGPLGGPYTPYRSDTEYGGITAEAALVHWVTGKEGAQIFAGGGFDSWRRNIKGDSSVSGATEYWNVLYVFAGGGMRWYHSSNRYHARAGIKYPFYTFELPDSYDFTLEPKGRLSYFAQFSADFFHAGRPIWGLGIYYDGYRFAKSEEEPFIPPYVVFQPESKQDVIGLYGIMYLF